MISMKSTFRKLHEPNRLKKCRQCYIFLFLEFQLVGVKDLTEQMVFHCRCFPTLLEEDQEIKHETTTQTKSSSVAETFYTAFSVLFQSASLNLTKKPSDMRVFTFAEIKAATNNFSTKIGDGEFGSTYKGVVKSLKHPFDEIQVVVKSDRRFLQRDNEWERGIKVLGAVEHPNLVKLIGYCSKDSNRLVVYEYMVNGSVRDQLAVTSETFLWTMRLKVAQDVACGLTYLHEETDFQIISRNFKSSNVLLDDQWNAKLSDFGVRQILEPDGISYETRPVPTVEYAPPEYERSMTLTSKSDVWSYGGFLYELITGRRPLDKTQTRDQWRLLEWVKPYIESKKFDQIVDPNLKGNYPLESVEKLCIIADKCLSMNPNSRPKMREILEMVDQLTKKPSDLRAFTLAEIDAATNNFSTKISRGEFGITYKGVVKSLKHPFDEIPVVVKTHRRFLKRDKEWEREINVLGAVEHPNLVKLIGYCSEDSNRLVVYEYVVNGSVRDQLAVPSETFLWTMRLKVAKDVACGLTYLHEETDFQIISRNFKSSNVLLDDQWNAKLSDFGVRQILEPDGACISYETRPVPTVEYAPPEYERSMTLTSKSDVWSYGGFLYELITGRRPLDKTQTRDQWRLLEWVKPYIKSKKFDQIVDPNLKGNYPLESVEKLCIIANKCLSMNPNSRPKMREILEMVNQLIQGPSQATSPASPQLPQVVVDPNNAIVSPAQGKKANEETKQEGQKGSMMFKLKKLVCIPHIRPLKILKSCSKKSCCVSLH